MRTARDNRSVQRCARSSNWIEQGTPKPKVASSILAGRTTAVPLESDGFGLVPLPTADWVVLVLRTFCGESDGSI